jgi:hypothetical protein
VPQIGELAGKIKHRHGLLVTNRHIGHGISM